MTAPRVGPLMASHVTGGPECKRRFLRIPGTTSAAMPMPTMTGLAAISRATASAFAFAIRSSRRHRLSPATSFASPRAGGFQST